MFQPRLNQSATVIFIQNEIYCYVLQIIYKRLSSNELASIDMHRRYIKVMLWHFFRSLHRNLVMLVLLTSLTKSIENLWRKGLSLPLWLLVSAVQ